MPKSSGLPQSPGLHFSALFFLRAKAGAQTFFCLLVLGCCLAFGRVAAQQVNPEAFVLSGSATRTSDRCYQLTGLATNQTAGLFYNNQILLTRDFDLEFDINFGSLDQNGADGLAFILQKGDTNPGQSGEGLGYQGLSPSLVVEFDTWQNTYDPAFDHIGIQRNGNPNHNQAAILAPVMASPNTDNIEDGQPHRVRLQWLAAGKSLRVYFDNALRLTMDQDIVATIFGGNAAVYWGFTAATGGFFNVQTICRVTTTFQEVLNVDVARTNVLCAGARTGSITAFAKGGAAPYQHSINNGTSFQTSPTFVNLPPGTYQVLVKDAANALSPVHAVTITEPAASMVGKAELIPGCFGSNTGSLQLSATGGTGSYTFSIDNGATWQASGLFPELAAGTYTVHVKDQNNCMLRFPVPVRSKPEMTTAITGSPAAGICAGEQVTLRRQGPDIAGATFTWTPAAGLAAAGPNATVSPMATTTYFLTTTAPDGCTEQDQVTVVVNPAAVADAGPDQRICPGSSISLGHAALPGYTYAWAAHPGLSDTRAAAPAFTAVNAGLQPDTIYLSLTATRAGGCSKTDQVRVVVWPLPLHHRISGSASVCPGADGVRYTIASPAAAGYTWEVSGGTLVTGQGTRSITVNWGPETSTAGLQARGVTPDGCPLPPLLLPVRINPLLITPKPAGPALLCSAQAADVAYETQHTNGSRYAWTVVGGSLVAPSTSHQVRIKWDTSRRGKLVVTESSSTNLAVCFGASDTLYVDFTASPDAGLAIQGPAAVCAASRQLLYSLAGLPGSTYRWTRDGTLLPVTGNSVALDFNAAGTHTLAVVETSSQGCVGQVRTKTITINPLPSAAVIAGPPTICPENLNGHVYTLAGLPGSVYAWTVSGGTIRSGQGSPRVVVDFDLSARKALSVLETSAAGCTNQVVGLSPLLDPSVLSFTLATSQQQDPAKNELQFGLLANAEQGNQQPLLLYRKAVGGAWARIAELPPATESYVDASAETNLQAYYYRLENTNNCGSALPAPLHKTILLQVSGEEASETVTLRWNAYQGWPVKSYGIYRKLDKAAAYTLYQTVAATDSSAVFVSADEGFVQQFRIQALPADGGSVSSWSNTAQAVFENVPAFYNIFTPNGDGRNEVFYIDNVHLYPDNELTVFNRYGKEVFRQKSYRNTWQGGAVSGGTYYYLFTVKAGRAYKGWVEIVK
jgi:gliding motility-associated-like protein